eukprot:CAMPEP_0113990610 /NCGR_PEP_ID=MMETSP0328-20130328/8642_1 /TAXON_ID=39455 /ORGANISM="Alexandrium minutum" /LENGTH=39 /assembly_acc=CAM_ASM_000350
MASRPEVDLLNGLNGSQLVVPAVGARSDLGSGAGARRLL